jgi:hypothetical protein
MGQVGCPASVAEWFCLVADGPPLISSDGDRSMSTAGKQQSESLFNDTGTLSKNRLDHASSGEHPAVPKIPLAAQFTSTSGDNILIVVAADSPNCCVSLQ